MSDPVGEIRDVHVMPADDSIEHLATEDCVCGPRTEPVPDEDDGSVGWIYVHSSLDGRELAE